MSWQLSAESRHFFQWNRTHINSTDYAPCRGGAGGGAI